MILVDDNDIETGVMEKMKAHRTARLHRAVSVFICNTKGEWLLQQRAANKYHSNSLWTNTACTHPFPGETNLQAANRRLAEEMGLKANLTKVFSFIYKEKLDNALIEHEFDHVFIGYTDVLPTINPDEVMNYKYISFNDLHSHIESTPNDYTVWFKKIYIRINDFIEKMTDSQK